MELAKRQLLLGGIQGASEDELSLYKRILAAVDDSAEISTMIRDSILGVSEMPLEDALAAEPLQINVLDDTGYAPLHWAAIRNDVQNTKILLQNGALVDIQTRLDQQTPLYLVASKEVSDTSLRLLLLLLQNGANPHAKDFWGSTPLHEAVQKGVENVRMLLNAGANPNTRDHLGCTPLHYVHKASEAKAETSSGAAGVWEYPVFTPREAKTACGQIISDLVEAGADPEIENNDGNTPLMAAAYYSNSAALWHLCQLGARLDTANRRGRNFLHHVALHGGIEQFNCLRTLGIRGLDPDHPDEAGDTPLRNLELRMRKVRYPGWLPLTHQEVFAFCALVVEIRRGNIGLSQISQTQLLPESGDERLQDWLGRQWQWLYDHPDLAGCIWDDVDTDFGSFYNIPSHSNNDINMGSMSLGLLFGQEDAIDDDEFFDALDDWT
jgi:ankyrin repeat protein